MSAEKTDSTPRSAIRTLRKPCSAARRTSSMHATSCSCPCADGADNRACRRAGRRGHAPAGVRPREQADLDARGGGRLGHRVELRVRVQEDARPLGDTVDADLEALGLLEHGVEARGPSVLGISTRYCAPSGNRFSDAGSSPRSPGGRPRSSIASRVEAHGDESSALPIPLKGEARRADAIPDVLIAAFGVVIANVLGVIALRFYVRARAAERRLATMEAFDERFPGAVLVFDRRLRHVRAGAADVACDRRAAGGQDAHRDGAARPGDDLRARLSRSPRRRRDADRAAVLGPRLARHRLAARRADGHCRRAGRHGPQASRAPADGARDARRADRASGIGGVSSRSSTGSPATRVRAACSCSISTASSR